MPTSPNLVRQNKSLEELGHGPIEYGSPQVYKWFHSADLLFPSRIESSVATRGTVKKLDSGLWIPANRYEYAWIRQVPRDCWPLAEWHPPMDPDAWQRLYHGEVPWPEHGLYMDTGQACYRAEPHDGDTAFVKQLVRVSRERSDSERLYGARELAHKRERENVNRTGDWLDDILRKPVVASYATAGPDRFR